MNKKLIIGISAAAVAAVIIGAAAALMTSSPPEKIDLSSTHTTEAATEPAKDTEPETPPAVTTAPETTAAAVENVTASLDTYTFGNISIQFPKVDGISDSKLQDTINESLRTNALSVIAGYEADEAKDTMTVKCQVLSVDRRSLTAVYTGSYTPDGGAHPVNLFYSNTMDLRSGSSLGLNDFTDSYTMAGYVLSSDVIFSDLTEEQTAAVLEYRQSLTIEELTNTFNQADFPIQKGVVWPPSFSYEKQGNIFFSMPVPHALGDYVIVCFEPSTK